MANEERPEVSSSSDHPTRLLRSNENGTTLEAPSSSQLTGRRSQQTPPVDSDNETVTSLAESDRTTHITVDIPSVTATLIGLPRIRMQDYVYEHRLDDVHEPTETRTIALFDITNTSRHPLQWQSVRTKFIGDDKYTYQPANVSLDPSQLGPGCHTRQVKIEPGRKARVATLVEKLPRDVTISEVIHELAVDRQGADHQLSFQLDSRASK